MPTAKQAAFQFLEDMKTRILMDDWVLGGLVVIISFFTIIIVLILFAVIFGCCSTERNKLSSRNECIKEETGAAKAQNQLASEG